MSNIDDIVKYIQKATELVEDGEEKEYFKQVPTFIENAKKIVNEGKNTEEKNAYLLDAVVRWASQITFLLFRHNKLTDELEAEYRTFIPVETTTEEYKDIVKVRLEKGEALEEKHRVLMAEDKELEVFKAVVGGMEEEQAKKAQAEYEQKLANPGQ